jgi:hypothetical protein
LPVILKEDDYENMVLKKCLEDERIKDNLKKKVSEYCEILENRHVPTEKQLMDAIEKMIQ